MEKAIIDTKKLLINHGPDLAKEFSGYTNESCIVAVFDKDKFTFTGVQIVEGSMGYSPTGTVVHRGMGHVLTQILHAMQTPEKIKSNFESGEISFGDKGTTPEWREYNAAMLSGLQSGIFLENGWRYPNTYQVAIPVFNNKFSLAGAFMYGSFNKNILLRKVAEYFIYYLKVMNKIPAYENIFNIGINRIRRI